MNEHSNNKGMETRISRRVINNMIIMIVTHTQYVVLNADDGQRSFPTLDRHPE